MKGKFYPNIFGILNHAFVQSMCDIDLRRLTWIDNFGSSTMKVNQAICQNNARSSVKSRTSFSTCMKSHVLQQSFSST